MEELRAFGDLIKKSPGIQAAMGLSSFSGSPAVPSPPVAAPSVSKSSSSESNSETLLRPSFLEEVMKLIKEPVDDTPTPTFSEEDWEYPSWPFLYKKCSSAFTAQPRIPLRLDKDARKKLGKMYLPYKDMIQVPLWTSYQKQSFRASLQPGERNQEECLMQLGKDLLKALRILAVASVSSWQGNSVDTSAVLLHLQVWLEHMFADAVVNRRKVLMNLINPGSGTAHAEKNQVEPLVGDEQFEEMKTFNKTQKNSRASSSSSLLASKRRRFEEKRRAPALHSAGGVSSRASTSSSPSSVAQSPFPKPGPPFPAKAGGGRQAKFSK